MFGSEFLLFDTRIKFPDLKIVHLGPKIIKIGQEMQILGFYREVLIMNWQVCQHKMSGRLYLKGPLIMNWQPNNKEDNIANS